MPAAKRKKVAVTGTKAPAKKKVTLSAAEKKRAEVRERLEAFINTGLEKVRDDVKAMTGPLEKHANCRTCRCDQANEDAFYEVGYAIDRLKEEFGYAFEQLDNPNSYQDW
jgi:hypothetical protein